MKFLKPTFLVLFTGMLTLFACNENEFPITSNPIIKITGTGLDFGGVDVNTTSSVRTFTMAAADLTGDITLTTEAPFYISRSFNENFDTNLSISPSDFGNEALTIYVQFRPTGSIEQSFSGTINTTSKDRDKLASIQLTGRATLAVPSIAFSKPSVIFSGIAVGQDSASQPYIISGDNIANPITVSTTAPFFASLTEGGTYTSSLDIPAQSFDASGTVTVFVRFSPTAAGSATGEITHTTTDLLNLTPIVLQGSTSFVSTLQMNDNFEYSIGDLPSDNRTTSGLTNEGLTGWIKVRNANTNIPVVDKGLTYMDYIGSGIGNAVELDMDDPVSNSNICAYNLAEQQDNTFIGSYYVSFMFKVESLPSAAFNRPVMFVDWLDNGSAKFLSALQVNYNAGSPRFGVMYEGDFSLTSLTPEVGKTYLVVLKQTITDTDVNNSNNTGSIYIFDAQTIPLTEPTTPLAIVNTPAGNDMFKIKAITLVKDNDRDGRYIVDGLRVTNTWEELFNNKN